jgi:hypothetical protein
VDAITGEHSHDDESSGGGSSGHDHSSSGELEEGSVMVFENSFLFTDLEPGTHTVSVVLNYDDHSAIQPPVIATETFKVKGNDGDGGGGIPAWALALGVVGGLIAGSAAMRFVGNKP